MHATVILLHMQIRLQEKDISFTLIWEMEIRFQVLKENRNWVAIDGDIDAFTQMVWEQFK